MHQSSELGGKNSMIAGLEDWLFKALRALSACLRNQSFSQWYRGFRNKRLPSFYFQKLLRNATIHANASWITQDSIVPQASGRRRPGYPNSSQLP